MTIDLTGLVRPHLVEMTKRDDNPNAAEFRLQPFLAAPRQSTQRAMLPPMDAQSLFPAGTSIILYHVLQVRIHL